MGLAAPACGADLAGPLTNEVRVTGTVTLDGVPRSVPVKLYHLGGASPAQLLGETTSGGDGHYDVSAEVDPGFCDVFFVTADLRPVGGGTSTSQVLEGCRDHTWDIEE